MSLLPDRCHCRFILALLSSGALLSSALLLPTPTLNSPGLMLMPKLAQNLMPPLTPLRLKLRQQHLKRLLAFIRRLLPPYRQALAAPSPNRRPHTCIMDRVFTPNSQLDGNLQSPSLNPGVLIHPKPSRSSYSRRELKSLLYRLSHIQHRIHRHLHRSHPNCITNCTVSSPSPASPPQ